MQAGTHRGLAGGGKKLLLAGSSQQGSTPGKGVRGGLRWETDEMGLVYLWQVPLAGRARGQLPGFAWILDYN